MVLRRRSRSQFRACQAAAVKLRDKMMTKSSWRIQMSAVQHRKLARSKVRRPVRRVERRLGASG